LLSGRDSNVHVSLVVRRTFEPLSPQVENWRTQQLSAEAAKLTIYRISHGRGSGGPETRGVHELYFNPQNEEFQPRTMWSPSNAFTSAFKELDPIPQFKATAKLGSFLEPVSAAAWLQWFFSCSARNCSMVWISWLGAIGETQNRS
jgi:hypothetical protein